MLQRGEVVLVEATVIADSGAAVIVEFRGPAGQATAPLAVLPGIVHPIETGETPGPRPPG